MKIVWKLAAIGAAAAVIIYFIVFRPGGPARLRNEEQGAPAGPGAIRVVAAEDFYGSVASQLGGNLVAVKSIISSPNIDPHEYESSVKDGIAVARAAIVIKNGLQYDTWLDKMLSASPSPGRIVITAGDSAPRRLSGNPHVWYGVDNMEAVAKAVDNALIKVRPSEAPFFKSNLARFQASLAPLLAKINEIRQKYHGTPVGLTETICLYLTGPMGLRVLTPFDFQKAIAEGNDPPAASVAVANTQVDRKEIKILIYNRQTVTPVTTALLGQARARGIPLVPVSETMPPGGTYQSWMLAQMSAIGNGLSAARGGR